MRYFDRARFKTFFKCVTGWRPKLAFIKGKKQIHTFLQWQYQCAECTNIVFVLFGLTQ